MNRFKSFSLPEKKKKIFIFIQLCFVPSFKKRFDVFLWLFCPFPTMYKVKRLKFYCQWSHSRGHNTEDILMGLLGLLEPTCPEPGMPFLTHTHTNTPHTQHTKTRITHTIHPHHHHLVSWLCRELFLMHMSYQSSHLESECQERRKKSFFYCSLKPCTENSTQYMWTEIKDEHPSFKSRTVLRSTIPGHQNIPSFSLYPVQRPRTTLQTRLFPAYHVSHCIFFPSSQSPVFSFLAIPIE